MEYKWNGYSLKKLKSLITSGSGVVVSLPSQYLEEINSLPDGSYEIEGTNLFLFNTPACFEIKEDKLFIYESDCGNVLYEYLQKAEAEEDEYTV